MLALPHADASPAGVVAFYAIVHLQPEDLPAALAEFHRVLAPGGVLALAFHIGSETIHVDELFGCTTSLDFVMHQPVHVTAALIDAGFSVEARLDRRPYAGAEHASERTYLLARVSSL
jgi:ubiquinone/menaquinone biosynthesis C-methylase UbiE